MKMHSLAALIIFSLFVESESINERVKTGSGGERRGEGGALCSHLAFFLTEPYSASLHSFNEAPVRGNCCLLRDLPSKLYMNRTLRSVRAGEAAGC